MPERVKGGKANDDYIIADHSDPNVTWAHAVFLEQNPVRPSLKSGKSSSPGRKAHTKAETLKTEKPLPVAALSIAISQSRADPDNVGIDIGIVDKDNNFPLVSPATGMFEPSTCMTEFTCRAETAFLNRHWGKDNYGYQIKLLLEHSKDMEAVISIIDEMAETHQISKTLAQKARAFCLTFESLLTQGKAAASNTDASQPTGDVSWTQKTLPAASKKSPSGSGGRNER